MANQDAENNLPTRDELVRTAVKFLKNPKVVPSPLKQKQEFLRRKGLSEDEVNQACELAGANENETETLLPTIKRDFTAVPINHYQNFSHHQLRPHPLSLIHKIKEYLNTVALFGAAAYCIYWFYKKFIAPFLFGKKIEKTVEESVSELDKTIKSSLIDMKDSISKVEIDVAKLIEKHTIDPSVPQLVQDLKQDLASLKGLLLSRKQFPSVPASIPTWQLATSTVNQEKTSEREDLDDAGSGSSTNNSDSSLEMIREDPPKN